MMDMSLEKRCLTVLIWVMVVVLVTVVMPFGYTVVLVMNGPGS